jgi:hypothetical protein
MNRNQVMGALVALKGAGIIGTFVTLEGIRFFDDWPSAYIIWPLIIIGFLMVAVGLGVLSANEN